LKSVYIFAALQHSLLVAMPKRCIRFRLSVCLSVRHSPVSCQNDSSYSGQWHFVVCSDKYVSDLLGLLPAYLPRAHHSLSAFAHLYSVVVLTANSENFYIFIFHEVVWRHTGVWWDHDDRFISNFL